MRPKTQAFGYDLRLCASEMRTYQYVRISELVTP